MKKLTVRKIVRLLVGLRYTHSVCQERICFDNFTPIFTEREVADKSMASHPYHQASGLVASRIPILNLLV